MEDCRLADFRHNAVTLMVRRTGKRILRSIGMYRPIQSLRYGICGNAWWKSLCAELDFYQQFIKTGDLCFDIGAHVGNKTYAFSELGAIVISLEPQPHCLRTLQDRFANDHNITIVRAAAGAVPGTAEMLVCDNSSTSSLSEEWVRRASRSTRLQGRTWDDRISVQIVTLDQLIAEYGLPRFCKIDVEGFEAEVLKGLSQPIEAVSFEITREFPEPALLTTERLRELGNYLFNWSGIHSLHLEEDNWFDASAMVNRLYEWSEGRPIFPEKADIYARRVGS